MRQSRPLVFLAAATVCSVGGTRLSVIAIPWLVLTTTGSPVLTGLVGMAELLPYVVAKALGGPLIDRIGARRIAIWSDCLSTIAIMILPLLFWLGVLSIWLLIPVVALVGVLRAPADAAKQALVPTVAALGNVPLERVTGILGASDRLAGTIGAAGAGALIVIVGPAPALIGNAVAFIASALLVANGMPRAERSVPGADRRSYRADFVAGWQGLRGDPVLVGLVVMIAITNLFDQAYAIVLLPLWVLEAGLDASFVGIFLATFSAGAIMGAAIAAAVAERVPRLAIYVVGFFFAGPMPMAILAMGGPVPIIVGVLVISGFAAGFLNPIIGAILFERIAPPLVGRVIALFGALAWVLMPFGGVYAGVLADGVGVQAALWLTAALYLAAALSPVLIPSFRAMNKPKASARPEEAISTAQSP